MAHSILGLTVRSEGDVVFTRQQARCLAELLELPPRDQTRLATVVSEVVREAFVHGGFARVEYGVADDGQETTLTVRIAGTEDWLTDSAANGGAGLERLTAALRPLCDMIEVQTSQDCGVTVLIEKRLPARRLPLDERATARVAEALATCQPESPLAELERQNQELLTALNELTQLGQELDDTNRGVVALYAELAASNAELEEFARIASHDLKEPMRTVATSVQLLQRHSNGRLDPESLEFIGHAVDGAKRAARLIDDLLAYSRVGTRGQSLERVETESILGEVLADLQAAIEESGAAVTCDPLPTVAADRSQMKQLLQNLVSNAIKFRAAEAPRIHVSAERAAGEWVLSVRDNGIGIDPEFADRIFVAFQRLHGQEEYPGTGIGLAICKKIVERHGGRLWVESTPGEGSTFRFTIPVQTGG